MGRRKLVRQGTHFKLPERTYFRHLARLGANFGFTIPTGFGELYGFTSDSVYQCTISDGQIIIRKTGITVTRRKEEK